MTLASKPKPIRLVRQAKPIEVTPPADPPAVETPARSRLRPLLVAAHVLLAVTAIPGGLLLIIDPSSGGILNLSSEDLKGSVFANYLVPGLVLFGLIGLGSAFAAIGLLKGLVYTPYLSIGVGMMLAAFEIIGMLTSRFSPLQPSYLLLGLAIATIAAILLRIKAPARTSS